MRRRALERPRASGGRCWWRTWQAHLVCNYTYTHPNYNGRADPAAMMADVLRAEPLLTRHSTFAKLFRFPYLAEGRMAEMHDGMRALLAEHGYRIGHVTIDTSDWNVSGRLAERLRHEPTADLAPYRRYYLAHLLDRATFCDRLARDVLGERPVPHTILLHHNLASALFLDDALAMFRDRGWQLIDAALGRGAAVEASDLRVVVRLAWPVFAQRHGRCCLARPGLRRATCVGGGMTARVRLLAGIRQRQRGVAAVDAAPGVFVCLLPA